MLLHVSNIKTAVEEHLQSENAYTYILLVNDLTVWWWSSYVPTDLPSIKKLYQQTNEQTNVIQEVVSPEVSMLNPAVMNKKQGDQMQFSLEKEDQEKNGFIQTIMSVYGL